jgi:Fur family peroxide stress response transcriptional regulator
MDRGSLVQSFRELGIRVTAQRIAVAEALADSTDHPTAQLLYDRVHARFPQITLGTIYNALALLEEKGFVQALTFENATRYDTNITPHANLVCVDCGRIVDVNDEDGMVKRLGENVTAASGFDLISQRVDFYGTCPDCRRSPGNPCGRASGRHGNDRHNNTSNSTAWQQ